MIRFQCTSCGWPVRVAQVCAGRRGRCPSCGSVIIIPALSTAGGDAPESPGQRTAGLSALAAAVKGPDAPKEDTYVPAPPPPMATDPAGEELALDGGPGDASERTEILPAEQESPLEKHKRAQERIDTSEKASQAPHTPTKKPKDPGRLVRIIVLAAIVAVAAVAVLAVILKVRRP